MFRAASLTSEKIRVNWERELNQKKHFERLRLEEWTKRPEKERLQEEQWQREEEQRESLGTGPSPNLEMPTARCATTSSILSPPTTIG